MKMKTIMESFERFVKEKKAINLTGTEIEEARISIAQLIDSVLQRPSNDSEINKMLRAKVPGVTKKDANLLLYLYKGVNEKGLLTNDENIGMVEEELNLRAQNFLDSFETEDQFSVFMADAPLLIKSHLPKMREVASGDSHQSKFMLRASPGAFSDFSFARLKNDKVYKDTTAGSGMKDFMHKDSPELKNINPDHMYIFQLEHVIQIAYEMLKDGLYGEVKPLQTDPLDNDVFVKNYIMGISDDAYQAKQELDTEDHPTFEPIITDRRFEMNNLFRYFYYGSYLRDTEEQQIKMIDKELPKILDTDKQQVKNRLVPSYSLLLNLVWNNFPQEAQDKYGKLFKSIVYTAEKSKFIDYDIKDLINKAGVLDKPERKIEIDEVSDFEKILQRMSSSIDDGFLPYDLVDEMRSKFASLDNAEKSNSLELLKKYNVNSKTISQATYNKTPNTEKVESILKSMIDQPSPSKYQEIANLIGKSTADERKDIIKLINYYKTRGVE